MLKLSKYVHIFDNKEHPHIALLKSFDLSTIFLDRSELELIFLLKNGLSYDKCSTDEKNVIDNLKQLGYIVECDDLEEHVIQLYKAQLKPKLSVLYLILTDSCNLACKYCFIEAGFSDDYKCSNMTWDTARKAIDMFIDQKDKSSNGEVMFYGGEPFLAPELLFQCLDYLDKIEPKISRSVISNGTLITDEIAKKLSNYKNVSVSISLDGPKELNDQNRVKKTGGGSYDEIVRGINRLKDAGVNVGVSCTINNQNVDNFPETLDWIRQEIGTNHLGANFLVDTKKEFVSDDYMQKANIGLLKFFDKNRCEEVYESRILRKLNAFVRNQPRLNDCAACGRQLVVSASGEIGICHEGLGEGKTFIGSVDDQFKFIDNYQIQEWAQRSPFSIEECLNCEALGICGGGCPYGAMLRYGSIWNIDRRFCIHSKETLKWLVWDLYNKTTSRIETESERQ